jgi:hypothetical protein
VPVLRLAVWVESGWKRKGVVLLKLKAERRARLLVGAWSAFLSEEARNRAPGEKSELKE